MNGDAIAAEALTWVGTPFRWQGRIKGVGCDCKGLVAGVAAACGRPEAASVEALCGDYGARVDARRLKSGLAHLFDPVAFGPVAAAPRAGDVALIRVDGVPQHLAICVPLPGKPFRVVEASCRGVRRVILFRRPPEQVDSLWRWRPNHG